MFQLLPLCLQTRFKMCAAIENLASCEIHSVNRFLMTENTLPLDIHRQLWEVYRNDILTKTGVKRWCIMFKDGRTNVYDKKRYGRLSIVTAALVAQIEIDDKVCENRHFTVTELSLEFPRVSQTVLYWVVTEKFRYQKFCAR